MPYESDMDTREIIRQATAEAIVRRNIKVEALAREIGRRPAQVYNWIQADNPQSRNNPIYLALQMVQVLNNPQLARLLIKKLAEIL